MRIARRHPWLSALVAVAIGAAAAVPSVSAAPSTTSDAPAPTTSAVETLLKGELVRVTVADYGNGIVRIVRVGDDRFLRFVTVTYAAPHYGRDAPRDRRAAESAEGKAA